MPPIKCELAGSQNRCTNIAGMSVTANCSLSCLYKMGGSQAARKRLPSDSQATLVKTLHRRHANGLTVGGITRSLVNLYVIRNRICSKGSAGSFLSPGAQSNRK